MDLLWLAGDPVLHIFNLKIDFQNGLFVKIKSSKQLWEQRILCFVRLFYSNSHRIRLMHKLSFLSTDFRAKAQFQGIGLKFSGIEGHSDIGPTEALHHHLQLIYTKFRN